MSRPRTKIIGIRLRAGALAGTLSWIVDAKRDGARLIITQWQQGADLPGSGVERDIFFPALRKYVAAAKTAIVGIDVAFGLGRRLTKTDDWETFLAAFDGRYADRADMEEKSLTAAKGRDASRLTDRHLGRRSEPHRRRQSHQTYHCLHDVLVPLIGADRVRAVPMQEAVTGKPVLCEVAPDAYARRGRILPPFKGQGAVAVNSRSRVLDWLAAEAGVQFDTTLREAVANHEESDLLWAIVCVVIADRVARGVAGAPPKNWVPAEGWGFA